jgi:hypothetical protein
MDVNFQFFHWILHLKNQIATHEMNKLDIPMVSSTNQYAKRSYSGCIISRSMI